MLVLALQFSKGIAGVGIVRTRSPGTPWQRSWRLVPCERGSPLRAGSLKTEEKTKFVDLKSRGGRILQLSISALMNQPMHQLGTGSNRTGRMPAND